MFLFNGKIYKDLSFLTSSFLNSYMFNYGYGFFETILFENSKLYFYALHLERMKNTIATFYPDYLYNFDYISEDKVLDFILRRVNSPKDSHKIKIIYGDFFNKKRVDFLVQIYPYIREDKFYKCFIHKEITEDFLKKYKTMNYMKNVYLRDLYKKNYNIDEVLFINKKGRIIEGTITNILVVYNKNLYYVEPFEPYLEGIIQKIIIENYQDLGFKKIIKKSRGFPLKFLRQADEVILTNSLILVQPVSIIYNKKFSKKHIIKNKGYYLKIREFLRNL